MLNVSKLLSITKITKIVIVKNHLYYHNFKVHAF